MPVCGACGHENSAGARFCSGCGSPLAAPATETRKTVTIVFCDLVGSTSLGERSDPEVLRGVMANYHATLRRILELHGGTVEKFVGDAAMAVFGVPHVHEDDALRAVRAAVGMRDAVGPLGLEVRIGVNTGEVVAATGETLVTGDAVNVAARLEQAAAAGAILIGEATYRLVRDRVDAEPVKPLTLKGKSAPVPAYQVLTVAGRRAPVTTLTSPFVGRTSELAALEQALTRAVDKRMPQLVTVVGEPGIGKSRLAGELLARFDGRVLVGRCLSYGDAITYWPLVEILEAVGDVTDRLAADEAALVSVRLAAAVGTPGAAASPDEIAWAFRRLLESLAREQRLIVVFEDIHWAEPTLLDLLEYVATFAQDVPLTLLCTARPELFEVRPEWATPHANATVVGLEPLEASHTSSLVDLLGAVPGAVRDRVVEAADGNPLFVEQLVAMHLESPDAELVVPPNLQALLAARIDRLEDEERLVIERAAVEGRLFHRGAVVELLPELDRRDIGAHLMGLVRRDFVRPDRASIQGDDGFRFGHILIRDAVYESMPKRLRAELHEKYADWVLDRLGADAPPEILGYHLEQAHCYAGQLGRDAAALGDRAARHLSAAGASARQRGDVAAARKLYERAVAVAGDKLLAATLQLTLAEQRRDAGDLDGQAAAVALARELNASIGDARIDNLARVQEATLRVRREPEGAADVVLAEAQAVIDSSDPTDDAVLARAWMLVGEAHLLRGDFAAHGEALETALEHAHAAGDRALEVELSTNWGPVIVFGAMPVAEGQRAIEDVLGRLGDVPAVQAFTAHVLGHLRARLGDFAGAVEGFRDWRDHFRELGNEMQYAVTAACLWDVLSLAGDFAAGEQVLREGYEILERMGEKSFRSTTAAFLGEAAFQQGRLDEAEQMALLSQDIGARDDLMNEATWRSLLAKVRARTGDADDAVTLGRRAVELVGDTDMLDTRAGCHLDLADVLLVVGDTAGARGEAVTARELFERKGNLVGVGRADEFLQALA